MTPVPALAKARPGPSARATAACQAKASSKASCRSKRADRESERAAPPVLVLGRRAAGGEALALVRVAERRGRAALPEPVRLAFDGRVEEMGVREREVGAQGRRHALAEGGRGPDAVGELRIRRAGGGDREGWPPPLRARVGGLDFAVAAQGVRCAVAVRRHERGPRRRVVLQVGVHGPPHRAERYRPEVAGGVQVDRRVAIGVFLVPAARDVGAAGVEAARGDAEVPVLPDPGVLGAGVPGRLRASAEVQAQRVLRRRRVDVHEAGQGIHAPDRAARAVGDLDARDAGEIQVREVELGPVGRVVQFDAVEHGQDVVGLGAAQARLGGPATIAGTAEGEPRQPAEGIGGVLRVAGVDVVVGEDGRRTVGGPETARLHDDRLEFRGGREAGQGDKPEQKGDIAHDLILNRPSHPGRHPEPGPGRSPG